MREHDLARMMVEYLTYYIGTFYSWGGDDPSGFDCSGLVIEGLKAVGKVPRGGWDTTAQGLYDLGWPSVPMPEIGCLVFWGRPEKIVHVEAVYRVILGEPYTIGASSGTSRTRTKEDAIRDNAFVKLRPRRHGHVCYIDPFTT